MTLQEQAQEIERLTAQIRNKSLERSYCKSWNADRVKALTAEIRELTARRAELRERLGIPTTTYYCHY